MSQSLKAGDKVICVDNQFVEQYLTKGEPYTVSRLSATYGDTGGTFVHIEGINTGSYRQSRFQLVAQQNTKQQPKSKTMSQPRLTNGRFTFKQMQTGFPPNFSNTAQVKQNQAVARGAQTLTFRPGSLYRVAGGPVARYKGTVKDLAVLTVHGKPLAVKADRVRLADKDDVQAYLADAKVA